MGVEVTVEGLTTSFGKQVIWGDVTLTLPPGEISVMLGPSGTGKSVFLKTLVGLLKPDRGSIFIRYLPPGAATGVGKPYLTIATYPVVAGSRSRSLTGLSRRCDQVLNRPPSRASVRRLRPGADLAASASSRRRGRGCRLRRRGR